MPTNLNINYSQWLLSLQSSVPDGVHKLFIIKRSIKTLVLDFKKKVLNYNKYKICNI